MAAAAARQAGQKADLDPTETLENWDDSAKVRFDRELLAELCTLRFIESGHHALFLGQVGVGKSFLANAIGLIACRRGHSVLMERTDKLLKRLKQGRLDNSHEAELRKLIRVDLLILDDFGLDALDRQESRDLYDLITERHRALLRGHTVHYTTASAMLNDLAAQDSAAALARRLRRYRQPELLVCDEVGYLAYDTRYADLLFEVVTRRYQTPSRSMIITHRVPGALFRSRRDPR